jgi:hypothetical protein
MAIFKNFTVVKNGIRYSAGETNTGLVINPLEGDLWIDSQPYDADTLYPLFSKPCVALKSNKVYENSGNGFVVSAIVAKGPCLSNGQDTGTDVSGALTVYQMGSRDHNLEDDKTLEMSSNLFRFTGASNEKISLLTLPYGVTTANQWVPPKQKFALIEGDDFSNPSAVAFGEFKHTGSSYESQSWPVYADTANKFIYFITYYGRYNSNSYWFKTLVKGVSRAAYTTNATDSALTLGDQTVLLVPNEAPVNANNGAWSELDANSWHYCGKNQNNTLLFLETVETSGSSSANQLQTSDSGIRQDKIFNVESYNPSGGGIALLSAISKTNLTDGSVAYRFMIKPRPSQFVRSPIIGETLKFYAYYPVADTDYKVSFLVLTWDTDGNSSAGSVTADNCTMTYGSGVVTDYLQYPTKYSVDDKGRQIRSNSFITKAGSDYFLHYLPSYCSPTSVAAQPALAKNLVTYQIDATDFSSLTYHSSVQVNACDFVHLNHDTTGVQASKIAVIAPGALKVYTWNNGWVETASETGDFVGVTKDNNGRIIGISGSANNSAATANSVDGAFSMINHKVHLIADSLPSTVTITFTDSSLTYTGSDLSTSIDVSAYDSSSARIAKSVDLKIDGANAKFTVVNGTSDTVTTSTSVEKNVLVTVTGPGPLTISASFTI